MIVDWPIAALPPGDAAIAPDYLNRPDQEATNGMTRSPGQSGARFRVAMIDIPVYDARTVRMLRSLLGQIEGRRNLVRFRLPDLYGIDGPFARATLAVREQYPNGVPFSSGVFFSSGVGFAISFLTGTLAEAAELNAREIYITGAPADLGGCYISIEDFCYTATGVWDEGGGVSRVRISPVLRRAAAADVTVEFAPIFVGVLQTDNPGYEAMKLGMHGLHTLEFVEDLTRARLPYSAT